jgi:hypothetical protein
LEVPDAPEMPEVLGRVAEAPEGLADTAELPELDKAFVKPSLVAASRAAFVVRMTL